MNRLWMTAAFLGAAAVSVGAAPPTPLPAPTPVPSTPAASPRVAPVPVVVNLAPGSKALLRVRQVIPNDGLSRGERLLNGRPPLQVGDTFTAEFVGTPGRSALILAGRVESVSPPRRFGRPGKVSVSIAWPLDPTGAGPGQWGFDVEDKRFTSAQRRRAITGLLLAEGFALGASVGTTLDRSKAAVTLGGGGVGLLFGVAAASLQPGQAASLEPGDTLAVVVGKTSAKKLPPESPLTVFPAHDPDEKKHGRKAP